MSRAPARSPSSDDPPVVANFSLLFSTLTCGVRIGGLLSGGKSPSCTAEHSFFAFNGYLTISFAKNPHATAE